MFRCHRRLGRDVRPLRWSSFSLWRRDRRLHREQVIEALWPGLSLEAAGPRLHKAAHYARRALGEGAASLVLRNDVVALLPDGDVRVDVDEFRQLGEAALAEGTPAAAQRALGAYGGTLLPDDVYDAWTTQPRESLRLLHVDLLRLAGRWETCCARTRPTSRPTSP